MARYCRPYLTPAATARASAVFRVLGYLSETFVFLFIGTRL